MKGLSQSVSIIVPAFNEEAAIGVTLRAIGAAMCESAWEYEIVVVDDGSTDSTARVAAENGARLVRLNRNCGYGAALKAGIETAQFPWILITDGDGTYPAGAIPALLALSARADMAVGARIGASVHIPWERRPAKRLLTWYAGWVCARWIPDLNSGLRLMRRAVIHEFWDFLPSGFSFTSTITLALLTNGQPVEYLPIDYYPRIGASKIRAMDFFRILRLITRMAWRFRPLRLVIPLASVSAVASFALLDWPGPWWGPLAILAAAGVGGGLERRAVSGQFWK